MYATTIGYTFLKAYNNKFQTNYTGRTFFEEVFVPVFFCSSQDYDDCR